MKTISIWEDTARPGMAFKQFSGEAEADVVIIGGGITGLTAAMLLSDRGMKVILLEAKKVGLGTTGNSTGNLYVTVDEHLSKIKKKWGSEVMKEIVRSRSAALEMIDSTVQRFKIDCDFVRTSFNYFSESDDKKIRDFIDEEYEALIEAGVQVGLSDITDLPFKVNSILTAHKQAQFHPLNYTRGLSAALSARCELFEESAVVDLDEKEGIVRTAHGSVKAKHIIMATHVPKGVYMVQTFLGAYREHGVVAELKTASCPRGIFWGLEQPKHSVRSFSSGEKHYVMVIGDKYKTGQGADTNEYVEGLKSYLAAHFEIKSVTHTWGGQQYRTADGLPYFGRHGSKTYFLTGFATDGLIYGVLGAMIVSDLISEKANEWSELYDLNRFTPVKSFKEYFKENVDVIGQYAKDVPWNKSEVAAKDFKRGDAAVIEHRGQKFAVYLDEQGSTHVCSAVCTHMKCIVNWNPAEKTWDCPCHGSRFTFNGNVIEGPAIDPLSKIQLDQ